MKLLILESAVSLAPRLWLKNDAIRKYHQTKKRMPIVNGSIHQHLLQSIPKEKRLDRPDILHFGLLTALGYREVIPEMEVLFSISDEFYEIKSEVNLPRAQNRFYGLLEEILEQNKTTQFIQRSDFRVADKPIIVFSRSGKEANWNEIKNFELFAFGGFAYGSIKTEFMNQTKIKLSDKPLDLWTAISNFLNLYNFHVLKK